jgi:hypothetical protein
MENYIAYLDLLGIKDLAKYSSKKYFSAMEDFRNHLISSAEIFNDKNFSSKSEIFFFSDSAFIETDDIETLFNYLIYLRQFLNRNELFFTAAITKGNLSAYNFNGSPEINEDIDKTIKELIAGKHKFLKGVIFQSKDISDVYVLQNNLKGVGVFVHESIFDNWKKDIRSKVQAKNSNKSDSDIDKITDDQFKSLFDKYLTKSFYFPSINTNTALQYYDLKLTPTELHESFFSIIIERYHSSNVKNKKYGRFYLSHLANWISSEDFSKIEIITDDGESLTSSTTLDINNAEINFVNPPIIFKKLILSEHVLISELKKSAHCFEYLYFFLLNSLYNQFENYNSIISCTIETINRNLKCKKYFTKIDELPSCVLSLSNKERFIHDYHLVLNNLSNKKEKLAAERRQKRKGKIETD